MDTFFELLLDNESAAGRAVSSVAVVAFGFVLASFLPSVVTRRSEDATTRYYARKLVRFGIGVVVLVVLAVIWRAFAGRIGVVLGLGAAGLAFAMQEVVGAIAGWFNILSGSIFRVGDRIQMGGVRGDVIDITPLRTKIMEMGTANEDGSWVGGRQYTGRIVAVSNKMTFTEPVFNYSTVFGFIWEELTVPVPYDADWHRAEQILRDEVASGVGDPGRPGGHHGDGGALPGAPGRRGAARLHAGHRQLERAGSSVRRPGPLRPPREGRRHPPGAGPFRRRGHPDRLGHLGRHRPPRPAVRTARRRTGGRRRGRADLMRCRHDRPDVPARP